MKGSLKLTLLDNLLDELITKVSTNSSENNNIKEIQNIKSKIINLVRGENVNF